MRFTALILGLGAAVIGLGLSLPRAAPGSAAPPLPAPAAPLPREAAGDGLPNPEYRLPPGELSPGEVVIQTDAGDAPDWSHAHLNLPEAHKATEGAGEVVAVLDTGCDTGHRDLKGQVLDGKDFTGSRSSWADVQGHGTWCAGCVAAARNDVGMLGVAPRAKLIIAKVLGDNGSGLSTWIAAGIDWSVAWRGPNGERVGVISMSLGSPAADARIRAACQRAQAAGVIVVAAAGNEGPREGTVGFPGGFPEAVCVGATDRADKVAQFSSRGPALFVAAPGVDTRAAYPGDRFATMSGTSMACPFIAGLAALYRSWCKARGVEPTPDGFRDLLKAHARDLPPNGRDSASGWGLVQPAKMFPGDAPPKPKEPEPKPPVSPPSGDRIELALPGLTIDGRRVRKIVFELEPK